MDPNLFNLDGERVAEVGKGVGLSKELGELERLLCVLAKFSQKYGLVTKRRSKMAYSVSSSSSADSRN